MTKKIVNSETTPVEEVLPTMYVWEKEIDEINGNVVKFKDWTEVEYNDKQIQYFITDTQKDLSAFYELCVENIGKDVLSYIKTCDVSDTTIIAAKVLEIYQDHDIKMNQVDAVGIYVMTHIKEIMEMAVQGYMRGYKQAIWKAFWTYEEWIHPDYFIDNIKVSDIKRLKD